MDYPIQTSKWWVPHVPPISMTIDNLYPPQTRAFVSNLYSSFSLIFLCPFIIISWIWLLYCPIHPNAPSTNHLPSPQLLSFPYFSSSVHFHHLIISLWISFYVSAWSGNYQLWPSIFQMDSYNTHALNVQAIVFNNVDR